MVIIRILLLGLLFASCIENRYEPNFEGFKNSNIPRRVDFGNEVIEKSIIQYIVDNNLNASRSYISLCIEGTDWKIIRITSGNTALYESSRLPSNYTVINNFVVFIFSDIDYYSFKGDTTNQYLTFYRELFKERNAELDSLTRLSHPPVWYVKGCVEEGLKFYGESYGDKYYSIPCGYTLKRSGSNLDSMWIEKDTIN